MPASRIEVLQDMPIFGGIRADVLAVLLERSSMVGVARDDYFFHQAEPAESMYVLETGRVAVIREWAGRQYRLGELHAGDCFGEMALLDLFPRSAAVVAVEPCTAIELSTENLLALHDTDLEQFALIQMNIARELSRRLRDADERLFQAHVAAMRPELEYAWT